METGVRSGTGAGTDAGTGSQKNRELRILLVEHVPADAERILRELRDAGMALGAKRVASEAALVRELDEFAPDIVLAEFGIPGLGGMQALAVVRKHHPGIPFVFVSGTIGEESAAAAIRGGARDYVFKENLLRLPHAVRRALQEAAERSAREAAEQALRRSEAKNRLLARLVEQSSDAIFSTDLNGVVTSWNAGAARLYGYRAEEAIGRSICLLDLASAGDAELETVLARIRDGRPRAVETQHRTKTGELRDVSISTAPLFDPHGAHVGEMTVARDVTERRLQEAKIARLSRIYALRSGINAAIVRVRDRQALFEMACRVALEHGNFGFASVGLLDAATQAFKATASAGTESAAVEQETARRAVQTKKPAFDNDVAGPAYHSVVSLPLLVRDSVAGIMTLYAVEKGYFDEQELRLLTELSADLSFALEHLHNEETLERLAYYSPLTGLPNRQLFVARLEEHAAAAQRDQRILAVAAVDLEGFRNINDTLGRQAGDQLLKLVAQRMRAATDDADILAHTGAGSFAMVLGGAKTAADVAQALKRVMAEALGKPFALEDETLHVSAKAGVALCPGDGGDAETLLRNAEIALKRAKTAVDRTVFYAPGMNARVAEMLGLVNRLRIALERQQFELHYQPKVELASRRIVGVEALIRWNDPESGLVPPLKFIPVLEETGLILDVGRWVLEQAVRDRLGWLQRGLRAPRVSVNVSQLQLRQADFVKVVEKAIAVCGGDCGLDLEITESTVMEDLDACIHKLEAVRAMQVGIALDDFGTGYSSLAYIARLPVNTVKIDRSFVKNLPDSATDMTIVSTIITLARSLELAVVAEGVETEKQAKLLTLLRCDEMQGYLFSPAVPGERIEALLAR